MVGREPQAGAETQHTHRTKKVWAPCYPVWPCRNQAKERNPSRPGRGHPGCSSDSCIPDPANDQVALQFPGQREQRLRRRSRLDSQRRIPVGARRGCGCATSVGVSLTRCGIAVIFSSTRGWTAVSRVSSLSS